MSIEAATRCAKPQPSKRLQRRRTCEPSVTSSLSMLPERNHLYLSQWSVFVTAVCLPWWIKRSKRKHRTILFLPSGCGVANCGTESVPVYCS